MAKPFDNTQFLAERLRQVESSPTLALSSKAKAMSKAGKAVIDFTAGEPDLPTPDHVKQAGIKAIENNQTRYTAVSGIPELRAAVAKHINEHRKSAYSPSQILVGCGAKHVLFNIFQALCQPGDEVILFAPYWVSFPPLVHLSGAKIVIVQTKEEDGFLPDPAAIAQAISKTTKAIVINSPNNPTGALMDEGRLLAIAKIARENGLIVISDEIYDRLVYPPARHISIIEVAPDLAAQSLIVGGVSKTYCMTGWRIGYVAGPQVWIEAMDRLQSHSTSNPASISQYAALAALTSDQRSVEDMVQTYKERRDKLVEGLNRLPGCHASTPKGAFYVWCNVKGLKQSASLTAVQWLEEALVATVPGEGFGSPDFIRFSFPVSLEAIEEGIDRLSSWIRKKE